MAGPGTVPPNVHPWYVTPLAILTGTGVVVPDLEPGAGRSPLPPAEPSTADPLAAVLDRALAALAATAHHGLRHGTGSRPLGAAAEELAAHGFGTSAALLEALAAEPVPRTWLAAQLHLQTAADLRLPELPPLTGTGGATKQSLRA